MLIKIPQGLFTDIRNVAGKLFATELRLANLDTELINMNTGKRILFDQLFAEQNSILEVVTVERNKCDQYIFSQRQTTLAGSTTIGDDLTFFDFIPKFNNGLLVQTSSLVQADIFFQRILISLANNNMGRIHRRDSSRLAGLNNHAGVSGHFHFHTGPHQGRFSSQQRYRLALHIRTHQRTVGVIMLQKRDQSRRNTHRLTRRNIHEINFTAVTLGQFAVFSCQNQTFVQFILFSVNHARRSKNHIDFLIRTQMNNFIHQLFIFHFSIRRNQETILINFGKKTK